MPRSYDNLMDFCEKNNVCEYCFQKTDKCNCYEEVMYNHYLDEQQEINEYLNR